MDFGKLTQYLNALVSNSILPTFKSLFNQSSREISDSIKGLEEVLSDDKSEAIELIRNDIKEGIAKLHKTKLAHEYAQFLNKLRFVKGDKGDMPSDEDMVKVFKPLIPAISKGEPGENGKDGSNGKDGKDGTNGLNAKPPTKKELKEIIKPLIPRPLKGVDGRDGADGEDGSPDKPKDIVAKLESLKGDKRLDFSAIKNVPELAKETMTPLFNKAVKYLRELQDVLITSPANNDVLKYDSTSRKWVNGTASGGVSDGDKGDITVSASGATWTIDANAVTFAKMQAITDGKLLGASGGTAVEEITVGSGLSLSSNILSVSGTGFTWTEVTGTTQAMAISNGYITNNASLVTCTLPSTAAVGSTVRVTGKGAGGWKIAQNASEQIIWNEGGVDGVNETTVGTGGYLQSNDDYDSVELICITADTTWGVLSSKGNIILN